MATNEVGGRRANAVVASDGVAGGVLTPPDDVAESVLTGSGGVAGDVLGATCGVGGVAPSLARRAQCARCLRAQSACICGWIRPVAGEVELLILQHPLEVANAKGSARLLHLSVTGSVMATGEVFDGAQLEGLLYGGGRTPLLLYPTLAEERKLGIAAPPPLPEPLGDAAKLRLVVLDGTWRKSRKMLYLNPTLHALARLGLTAPPPSHYRIRKAHAPDQLSTLEAACHALASLEQAPQRYQALLDAFDGLVAGVAARMGRDSAA